MCNKVYFQNLNMHSDTRILCITRLSFSLKYAFLQRWSQTFVPDCIHHMGPIGAIDLLVTINHNQFGLGLVITRAVKVSDSW